MPPVMRSALALAALLVPAHALRLPVRRGDALGLHNQADRSYRADLELGGQNFTVLIDTGRWVVCSTTQTPL